MKLLFNKLFLFITFFAMTISVFPAPAKHALIIGINKYKPADENAVTLKKMDDLDGCINDALAIRDIIKSRFGFEDKDITLLLDSTGNVATKEKILASIENELIGKSKPGDIVFFYYAGHGSAVKNSLSPEADKKDETIVPSDAWKSTVKDLREIRDKEFAKLFQRLADKKVILTLIFDSCHSGSIGRGADRPISFKSRFIEPLNNVDVADASPSPEPEKAPGVLIISAAQDYQTAGETVDDHDIPHGVFTNALIKVLRTGSVSESSESIFIRAKAIMQADGKTQEPVIAGTQERRMQTLLGIEPGKLTGKTLAGVIRNDEGEIQLQGGYAIGLTPGSILKKVNSAGENNDTKLKVVEVLDLNKSSVEVISGKAEDIQSGDLFEVVEWSSSGITNLKIWIPESSVLLKDLAGMIPELEKLKSEKGIVWVDDPTISDPDYEIFFENKVWKLKDISKAKLITLGAKPDFPVIKKNIGKGDIKLYVNVPPPLELCNLLKDEFSNSKSSIAMADAKSANYIVSGRVNNGKCEYSLVIPGVNAGDDKFRSSLPVRTDWLDASDTLRVISAFNKIKNYTYKLGKIRAWLTLETPPDEGNFPYKLGIKNSKSGQVVNDGNLYEGEKYGFVLVRDSLMLNDWDGESRFVYIFALDNKGRSTLLYPASGSNVENNFPLKGEKPVPEIQIGKKELFKVTAPGYDTYLMLTTREAIPDPLVLNFDGVRTRGASKGSNALSDLLTNVGMKTRSVSQVMPANWSLQRDIYASKAKK